MQQELYGGALRSILPTMLEGGRAVRFDDMSNLRQVPDNQEVFSDVDNGCAVIVELLARNEDVPCEELASYHFAELARANGCTTIQALADVVPGSDYDAVVVVPSGALSDDECPHFPLGPVDAPLEAIAAPTTTGAPAALQREQGSRPIVEGKFVIEGTQRIAKYKRPSGDAAKDLEGRNEVYVGLAVIRLAPPVDTEILISVSAPLKVDPNSSEAKALGPGGPLTVQQAQSVLRTIVASLEVVRWSLFL